MDEKDTRYPCVFGLTDDCPIRRKWKLKPESLVTFCACCNIRLNELEE